MFVQDMSRLVVLTGYLWSGHLELRSSADGRSGPGLRAEDHTRMEDPKDWVEELRVPEPEVRGSPDVQGKDSSAAPVVCR